MKLVLSLVLVLICKVGFAGDVGEDKKPECSKHKQEGRQAQPEKKAKTAEVVVDKKEVVSK